MADGGSDEVNGCFKSISQHPTLCHFKKGISLVMQWTGKWWISSCMPVSRSTQNVLWIRWTEHSQQYIKTRISSWNFAYAKSSTYLSFTPLSTMSLQSIHMGPLTATTQSLQSVFISILQRYPSEQVTDKITRCRWQLGCLVMMRSGVLRCFCARPKETV